MPMPIGDLELEVIGGEVATVTDATPFKDLEVSVERVSVTGTSVAVETAEVVVPGTLVVSHQYSIPAIILEPGQTTADLPADFPPNGLVFRKTV